MLLSRRYQVMLTLEVLPNDACNDAQCHAAFFIQTGHSKADIILFTGHTEIKAGMGNGIYTVGEADIHNSFVDICYLTGIFALDAAFSQIIPAVVLGDAFHICCNADVLHIVLLDLGDTDKYLISDVVFIAYISNPFPADSAGNDGTFHAEYLYTNGLLGNTYDTGLYNPVLVDMGSTFYGFIHVEGLTLPKHGFLAAADNAFGFSVHTFDHEIHLTAQHTAKDFCLEQQELTG